MSQTERLVCGSFVGEKMHREEVEVELSDAMCASYGLWDPARIIGSPYVRKVLKRICANSVVRVEFNYY